MRITYKPDPVETGKLTIQAEVQDSDDPPHKILASGFLTVNLLPSPSIQDLSVSGSPTEGQAGTITVNCKVTPPDGVPPAIALKVQADLSAVGGSSAQTLTQTDTHWSWTGSITAPSSGKKLVSVTATGSGMGTGQAQVTVDVKPKEMVAIPEFQPNTRAFGTSVDVSISCATAGATIMYTLDGSPPARTHGTAYTGGSPLHLAATTTIKAIAYKDGMGDSEIAEAQFVKGQAPFAADQTVQVDSGQKTTVTLTASDPDNAPQPLKYIITARPLHGTLKITGSGITIADLPYPLPTSKVDYTPEGAYFGSDEFRFKANDGSLDSNQATVTLGVGTSPPSVELTLYRISDRSGTKHTSQPGVEKTTVGAGDQIRITLKATNTGGSVAAIGVLNVSPANNHASLIYNSHDAATTPSKTVEDVAANMTDADQYFSFDIEVPAGASGQYQLLGSVRSIAWTPVYDDTQAGANTTLVGDQAWIAGFAPVSNSAPIPLNQTVNVSRGIANSIVLEATDADNGPEPLRFIISALPVNGILSDAGGVVIVTTPYSLSDRQVLYTPSSSYNRPDSFKFRASDGVVVSNEATVSIGTSGIIGASHEFNLVLRADGSINAIGWYSHDYGQCNVPLPNSGFLAVAAGDSFSLGLKSDGSILAWGVNSYGQCSVPTPNSDFIAVSTAANASCGLAIKTNGSIVAWGYAGNGQLNVPPPNLGFAAASINDYHCLGLKADGSVVAWGNNTWGQCSVPLPNAQFIAVAAGSYHSLGLKTDGSIVAWGSNGWGQCQVPMPNNGFIAIAAGADHSVGLKKDGSVVAWGWNATGQCTIPSPNSGYVAVAAGVWHTLGLKADGSVVQWGTGLLP